MTRVTHFTWERANRDKILAWKDLKWQLDTIETILRDSMPRTHKWWAELREEEPMKIEAWDIKRKQYIPEKEFAITGDGRLLIRTNESSLLYPPGTPSGKYEETDDISIDDVTILMEEEK